MLRQFGLPLLFLFTPVAAATPVACPQARIGISDLGYTSFRHGDTYAGIAVDLVREIERRTGCPFQIVWYPHSRLFAQFLGDQLQVTGAALHSAERDRHGVWIPYAYSQFELLLTSQSSGPFHSLADFVDNSSARLNVSRGISYPPRLLAQMERLARLGRLEYVNDYGVAFRKIQAGRAEGILAPRTIHLLHQRQFHMVGAMSAATLAESPRSVIGLYVSTTLVAAPVRQRYIEAIRAMVAEGTVQSLYARYLGDEVAREIFSGGVGGILELMPQ
jgi:polar amino acid transport system substrate-binding protein